MKSRKILVTALPCLALGALVGLTGCAEKYDERIVIYNWEDYIYEGTDDDGYQIDDSLIERFQKDHYAKTGKKIKVDYECFSTNEIMYQQLTLGAIKPDLICPSDYMIQKMANADLLEEFSYDEVEGYGESLSNWDTYGSPYIRNRFAAETLANGKSYLKYAVPYFWGTMGFTYDMSYFTAEEVGTWECLWNNSAKFNKKFTLKDSMRDTYVTAIFHVYRSEILALDVNAADYNEQLSAIFNRCDDATLEAVKNALIEAKHTTVYGFEVDEGKDGIVEGTYKANLAWSGDSVYSMDSADEANKTLGYALPTEGSNVWFDGWCMPKGAQKELAEEFVNFICAPENAQLCMEAVGYTSPIVGDEIWEYVEDTYAAEDGVEADTIDLSFYFGEEGKTIDVAKSERGRQFDAQYPTEEVLKRCCMMKDFGANTSKVDAMWAQVKSAS